MKLLPYAFAAAIALSGCAEGNHEPTIFGDADALNSKSATGQGPSPIVSNVAPVDDGGLGARRDSSSNTVSFNEATGEYDPAAVVATIYFGFDKYVVSTSEQSKLAALNATGANLIAAGYADYFGTDQYNQALSDRRANSVKNYLTGIGYQDGKIEIQAFGKRYAKQGGSRADVAKDRRVVIVNRDHK
ncbi:MAG: OmpA family protein [Puniceicoccales bacterium]|nr:OmpA family protein [Puniceicoccales bacterium]